MSIEIGENISETTDGVKSEHEVTEIVGQFFTWKEKKIHLKTEKLFCDLKIHGLVESQCL